MSKAKGRYVYVKARTHDLKHTFFPADNELKILVFPDWKVKKLKKEIYRMWRLDLEPAGFRPNSIYMAGYNIAFHDDMKVMDFEEINLYVTMRNKNCKDTIIDCIKMY